MRLHSLLKYNAWTTELSYKEQKGMLAHILSNIGVETSKLVRF